MTAPKLLSKHCSYGSVLLGCNVAEHGDLWPWSLCIPSESRKPVSVWGSVMFRRRICSGTFNMFQLDTLESN